MKEMKEKVFGAKVFAELSGQDVWQGYPFGC